MKKPGPMKKSQLVHPKGMVRGWNGELRPAPNPERWNGSSDYEDQGFHSRGVHSTSGNHQPRKREVVNGALTWVDPKASETTGRAVKPAPASVVVGGLMQGRHEPTDNAPTHHRVGGSDA